MGRRDFNDIMGGGTLIAFGLFVSLYASTQYAVGTVAEMGPGMVPAGLGLVLAALGIVILVPALFRAGALPRLEWRPFLFVLFALAAFAVMVERVGVILAIYALVFIAMLGDDERRPVASLVLATVLNLIVIGIFVFGLGLPFKLLTWDLRS
jgi:hypothetical protein